MKKLTLLFIWIMYGCDVQQPVNPSPSRDRSENTGALLTSDIVDDVYTSDLSAYTQICNDSIAANIAAFMTRCPEQYVETIQNCQAGAATHEAIQKQEWQARLVQKDADLKLCYIQSIGVPLGELVCSLQLQYKLGFDLDFTCNKKVYL